MCCCVCIVFCRLVLCCAALCCGVLRCAVLSCLVLCYILVSYLILSCLVCYILVSYLILSCQVLYCFVLSRSRRQEIVWARQKAQLTLPVNHGYRFLLLHLSFLVMTYLVLFSSLLRLVFSWLVLSCFRRCYDLSFHVLSRLLPCLHFIYLSLLGPLKIDVDETMNTGDHNGSIDSDSVSLEAETCFEIGDRERQTESDHDRWRQPKTGKDRNRWRRTETRKRQMKTDTYR